MDNMYLFDKNIYFYIVIVLLFQKMMHHLFLVNSLCNLLILFSYFKIYLLFSIVVPSDNVNNFFIPKSIPTIELRLTFLYSKSNNSYTRAT